MVSMRRLWWLGLILAGSAVFMPAVLPASVAPAAHVTRAAPAVTCPQGYRELINNSGHGYAIVGHGSGQFVSLTSASGGTCWTNVYQSQNVFLIQNENAKCLKALRTSPMYQVEEAVACNASDTSQQWAQFACQGSTVFGNLYTSGYLVASVTNGAPVYADSSPTCLPITLWSA